jgi:hypothetical protein
MIGSQQKDHSVATLIDAQHSRLFLALLAAIMIGLQQTA